MINLELLSLQSGAASFVSPPVDLGDLICYGVFVQFPGGGTLAGTFSVEASPDTTSANFVTITGSLQAVLASAYVTYSFEGQGYRYFRVRWAFTSGAGNMTVLAQLKENVVKGA